MAERKVRPIDIARFIPVSITTVSAWMTGRWQPSLYHRDRVRLLLNEEGAQRGLAAVSEDELNAALERDGGKHG